QDKKDERVWSLRHAPERLALGRGLPLGDYKDAPIANPMKRPRRGIRAGGHCWRGASPAAVKNLTAPPRTIAPPVNQRNRSSSLSKVVFRLPAAAIAIAVTPVIVGSVPVAISVDIASITIAVVAPSETPPDRLYAIVT